MKSGTRTTKKSSSRKNTGKQRADHLLEASELLNAKKTSLFDKITVKDSQLVIKLTT